MTLPLARPSTLDGVFDELTTDDAHLIAGGQSVVVMMNTGLFAPEKLVSLSRVTGLDGLTVTDSTVEIGAMCTHERLAHDTVLAEHIPAAGPMFRGIGNIRVRSAGTLGGNLVHADPAQDPPVLLSALGAEAVLVRADSARRVPVEALATGPFSTVLADDEVLTRVSIPLGSGTQRAAHIKFLAGTQDDYATVNVSAWVRMNADGTVAAARLTAGAIGPTVVTLSACGDSLVGASLTDEDALSAVGDAIRQAVEPETDRRGSADYKRHVCAVTAVRALRRCAETS